MSLEELLKPLLYIDEQIHRPYVKAITKWEDKGHSRYPIAISLVIYAYCSGMASSLSEFIVGSFGGWDMHSNITKKPYGTKEDFSLDIKTISPTQEFYKKIDRSIRLPLFMAGCGYMAQGGYNLINAVLNSENQSAAESLSYFGAGSSLLAMASSLYVKDINPKILDKQPFWKTAYDWIREKAIPTPTAPPVPIYNRIQI